jgi:hypothetical protein
MSRLRRNIDRWSRLHILLVLPANALPVPSLAAAQTPTTSSARITQQTIVPDRAPLKQSEIEATVTREPEL